MVKLLTINRTEARKTDASLLTFDGKIYCEEEYQYLQNNVCHSEAPLIDGYVSLNSHNHKTRVSLPFSAGRQKCLKLHVNSL